MEMTALPDQTASVPLLKNSTEHYSDYSTRESSQPKQDDLRSLEGTLNDAPRLVFPDDRFWPIAGMVGGYFIAVALAVGHHFFLRYLRDLNIEEYPQVWIKGVNNGFSNIFSLFVGWSASAALTQIKWRVSGSGPLPMYAIDKLFALPGPFVLLKTLFRPRRSLFLPILSSVLIQALVLVNILAPSALTVAPSEQVSRDIEVPVFNLTSQQVFAQGAVANDEWVPNTLNLTNTGKERIISILVNLPELPWTVPQGCGLKCAFYFEYNAPGLECQDVIPQDSSDRPNMESNIYQASSNLYLQDVISPSLPYDLSINYTGITNANLANMTFSPRAGTYCRFYNAIYNASFEFDSNNSTQRASTSIISHGAYLSMADLSVDTYTAHTLASWASCYGFAQAFQGNFPTYMINADRLEYPVIESIFNFNISTWTFELAVSNLSQTLVDLFSNLTLSLLLTRGGQDPVIANATTWDGSSVWIYTPSTLWAAYLPAMILAIYVALNGLYTIHLSGIAMDDKFSSFLLTTQDAELSERCRNAANFENLQELQLIHQKKGTFVVVDSALKSPN